MKRPHTMRAHTLFRLSCQIHEVSSIDNIPAGGTASTIYPGALPRQSSHSTEREVEETIVPWMDGLELLHATARSRHCALRRHFGHEGSQATHVLASTLTALSTDDLTLSPTAYATTFLWQP